MRFLIVDHYYSPVVDGIYGDTPHLAQEPYNVQLNGVHDALFGETQFQVAALRLLGHEAADWLLNVRPLAAAWYRSVGRTFPRPARRLGLRRGWLPWLRMMDDDWMSSALLARVREFEPDVVHIQCVALVPTEVVRALRRSVPLVSGQLAADIPGNVDLRSYGLMISSLPWLVRRWRRDGIDAEWLPLAFEGSLVDQIGHADRDLTASFVGSITVSHPTRISTLTAVAEAIPLHIWTANASAIPERSPLRLHLHGKAFGREMYQINGRSLIALNNHARIAAGEANNLRLYEATGMGALLVTEAAHNLRELFDVGTEVVTYRDGREAAAIARYYVDHPDEAALIATAGQRRTLRDHNWNDRMKKFVAIARSRIGARRN